jgi:hypothetical protein
MTYPDEDHFIKHAALIWQQDGCTVSVARFKAWCEGPTGYAQRVVKQMETDND